MRRTQPRILPEAVVAVRQEFERWRKGRQGHSRIPEPLWGLAVKAAGECGVWSAAQALGVNYRDLQKRYKAATPTSRSSTTLPSRPVSFVEFMARPPVPSHECIVEVEPPSGGHLRIRLAGPMKAEEVVSLTTAVWR